MIKRVLALFTFLFPLCTTVLANQEVSIKLNNKNRVYSEPLGFAYITFEYLYNSGHYARVRVSVENITQNPPLAVLVFRRDLDEKSLAGGKPKIEFEKKYPGEKGKRMVAGCNADHKYLDIITAAETDTLFTLDVPLMEARDLTLPLYVAKYKPKNLYNKGENNIPYRIFEEYLYDIHIEVDGWSEEDPAFVEAKNSVAQFVSSLREVKFCPNKRHSPSLKEQLLPYQEKRDSLITAINTILEGHRDWMSTDAPHIAYTKLLTELNDVDLSTYVTDCGNHKIPMRAHKCGYCSLSAQELYHRLDDLYQQLHAGNISKEQALKTARAINNCYQHSNSRKRNSFYGGKIAGFFNRIANY